jgi:hypothetical protein
MLQTKCLVVGSCTGQKDDEGCPEELKLKEADFSTAANLSKAEQRAKDWMKTAGKMYTGRQHALMMNGVEYLRADFDAASFDVAIVSAGYGLISEERLIAPYNITFQGKGLPWVRERGKALKLPVMTRELLSQYQVVFFLLGKQYLASLDCPLEPAPDQKFIYFGTGAERFCLPDGNNIIVPAAQKEASRYGGAGVTGIKGRMFDLLAKGISANPKLWRSLVVDRTANTIIDAISEARNSL